MSKTIYSEDYRNTIKKLKKARVKAGLKQVEVAKSLDKPQSYVSKIETYQRRVDILELKRLASLYTVKLEDLL